MEFDYEARRVFVGSTAPRDVSPHVYLLCALCAEKLRPPRGWELVDDRAEAQTPLQEGRGPGDAPGDPDDELLRRVPPERVPPENERDHERLSSGAPGAGADSPGEVARRAAGNPEDDDRDANEGFRPDRDEDGLPRRRHNGTDEGRRTERRSRTHEDWFSTH